jgi:putative SOS response-associated peptidase YedK
MAVIKLLRRFDTTAIAGRQQVGVETYAANDMEAYPVSSLVNSPKNDRAELIQKADKA